MNSTSNNLALVASRVLPTLSGAQLTYTVEKNIFLTMGYTSQAGNTYYRAIRLSPRLAVFYNIGEGYKYTFLNGITLFAFDGYKPRIIGQRTWGGYDWVVFSENFARQQSILMVHNLPQFGIRISKNSKRKSW